uniref:Uncharacterized protein n=1 Tax=Trichobilharzia regenti TaxID=157069 RepID=A0AA85K5T8_TRIRE|nr:unnamed protein product [Trichobilharzia regenti]
MEPIWSRENIRALQNLLTDPEERENGSDHDDAVTPMSKIKPSDIGPKPKSNVKKEKPIQKAKNPDDIWDADKYQKEHNMKIYMIRDLSLNMR